MPNTFHVIVPLDRPPSVQINFPGGLTNNRGVNLCQFHLIESIGWWDRSLSARGWKRSMLFLVAKFNCPDGQTTKGTFTACEFLFSFHSRRLKREVGISNTCVLLTPPLPLRV